MISQLEYDSNGNDKEYEVEAIWDSAIYAKKSGEGHLLGFYYLVLCKDYPEKENTLEAPSTMQYLQKLLSIFYKKHWKKQTATSCSVNNILLMAKPMDKPSAKFFT